MKFGLRSGIIVAAICTSASYAPAEPVVQGVAANETRDVGPAASQGRGCAAQLGAPERDLYRALTHGSDVERASAALYILQNRATQSRAVLRRAIAVAAKKPFCSQLRPLTDVVEDVHLDDLTRSAAAASLGVIARDFPCTFPGGTCPRPHDPIPSWAQHALGVCAAGNVVVLARACVEALGYVKTADLNELIGIRENVQADTMLRIAAGRALSRLTKTKSVTPDLLDKLVLDATKVSQQ